MQVLILSLLFALQLPPGTRNPDDNQALDFSEPFDVIVYIILPVLIVILYFYWRKRRNGK